MARYNKVGFLPTLSAKKLNINGPNAAPKVTSDEIHDACSGVIGVSKGLSDKSTPESFVTTGEDHVKAVPAISWMKFAEIKTRIHQKE